MRVPRCGTRHDSGAGVRCHVGGAVLGAVVDHDDVVDQADAVDQAVAHRRDDPADGALLVTGGNDDGDSLGTLALGELRCAEVVVVVVDNRTGHDDHFSP